MYIKREPLGRGNLNFGKRRRRFPLVGAILYLAALAGVLLVFVFMDRLQPKVLAALGPDPAPTASPAELLERAQIAYHDGNLEEAVQWYAQVAALSPDDMQVQFEYARVLTLARGPQNDYLAQALATADSMILAAPDDPRGYAARSRALDWAGEYDQAQIEALKAIELDPDYALGHAYLAEAYADLGRYRQAREQAELALALDPYHVDVRRNYAYVLEFYGDYQGAIQQYIQGLTLEPNVLDLWYGLARNYRGAGQMDKSVETYAKIAERTPDDPMLYVEWGRTYFEMRDDDAAQFTLERAVSLVCDPVQDDEETITCPMVDGVTLFDDDDDNPWKVREGRRPRDSQIPWDADNRDVPDYVLITAWNRLGQVYLTRRNYEDAVAILAEAIAWGEAQDPDDPAYQNIPIESYYVTASAYYYMNMCQFAIPLAVQALEIYEDKELEDPGAQQTILRLFVLCRDYASEGNSYIHEGPGFVNGFPEGYEEPDVIIQRPGSQDSEDNEEESDE